MGIKAELEQRKRELLDELKKINNELNQPEQIVVRLGGGCGVELRWFKDRPKMMYVFGSVDINNVISPDRGWSSFNLLDDLKSFIKQVEKVIS